VKPLIRESSELELNARENSNQVADFRFRPPAARNTLACVRARVRGPPDADEEGLLFPAIASPRCRGIVGRRAMKLRGEREEEGFLLESLTKTSLSLAPATAS